MDKQLLKAYIKTIVEEEVEKILPKLLAEAVSQARDLKENTTQPPARKIDRATLASMMDLDYDGFTLTATTSAIPSSLPSAATTGTPVAHPTQVDPKVLEKITGNYSAHMKKLGL